MFPWLFFAMAAFGVSLSAMVLRADPGRRDSRLFATLGILDSINLSLHGVFLLAGYSLAATTPVMVSGSVAVVLAYVTVEFAWSFPFEEPLPRRYRIPLLVA